MTIAFILFFASLAGIAFMLGRKLSYAKNMPEFNNGEPVMHVPNVEELKQTAEKKMKRWGFVALVIVIRGYVKSSNYIRGKSSELAAKIKRKLNKNAPLETHVEEPQEVSKFLKLISEYKQKVKRIKRKISEEENE